MSRSGKSNLHEQVGQVKARRGRSQATVGRLGVDLVHMNFSADADSRSPTNHKIHPRSLAQMISQDNTLFVAAES